jgi:hypothetical protein
MHDLNSVVWSKKSGEVAHTRRGRTDVIGYAIRSLTSGAGENGTGASAASVVTAITPETSVKTVETRRRRILKRAGQLRPNVVDGGRKKSGSDG